MEYKRAELIEAEIRWWLPESVRWGKWVDYTILYVNYISVNLEKKTVIRENIEERTFYDCILFIGSFNIQALSH